MATVLTISGSDLLALSRLDQLGGADLTAATADASYILSAEQEATEQTIKPASLADLTLRKLLTRNVAKLLAAELLEMRGREEGASGSFSGAGIEIAATPDHAKRLREEARVALALYLLAPAESSEDPALVAARIAKLTEDADAVLRRSVSTAVAAGVMSADEGRALLGLSGSAAVSLTSAQLDARRRMVNYLRLQGQVTGSESWIAEYLGLPGGVTLGSSSLRATISPASASPAGLAAQDRLFGPAEAGRGGRGDG